MLIAQQDLATIANKQTEATAITIVVTTAITSLGFPSQDG
jgi:hypothetical protein